MSRTVPLAFIDNAVDRAHPRRRDADWIESQRARPEARFVVIADDRALHRLAGNPGPSVLFERAEAERLTPGGNEMFLGLGDRGAPLFARMAPRGGSEPPGGIGHNDLRSLALAGEIAADEVSMVAMARSMLAWHESHRFCSKCGEPSAMTLGGFRRDCPGCGAQHFPRVDPVVIMLVSDRDRALVARSARFPPGRYSALAGFVEPGETIEQAVRREVLEEVGIGVGRVTYHSSQPWPFPSSLMIGCHGEAEPGEIRIDPDEIEDAMWATKAELRAALAGTGRFTVPDGIAIAHHLIRSYAETGV